MPATAGGVEPGARRRAAMRLEVRRQEPADLPAAAAVAAAAFAIDVADDAARARFQARVAHVPATDPEGAFVATLDGRIVGVAQAMVRERLWCLSLLTVDPSTQSSGAGRALMERALAYGTRCDARLIVSSSDPRALRLYARSGFALRPALSAHGSVEHARLPPTPRAVTEHPAGGVTDALLEGLADLSREVRGAPHTLEIRHALAWGGLLLTLDRRGFAVAARRHGLWLLVARDDEAGATLLAAALAATEPGAPARVGWITAGHDWAVSIALAAGLEVAPHGALCVNGDAGPLRPFLPSAPFA